MESNYVALWDRCLTIIKDNIEEAAYEHWFVPIKPYSFRDNALTLLVPSAFFYEYLEEKYLNLLRHVMCRVFGNGVQLMYKVAVVQNPQTTVELESTTRSISIEKPSAKPADVISPFKQYVYEELNPQLNPNYTFGNYYAGESNLLARSTGEAIAEKPGKTPFNPMFIYGESGVGKTHLLQAIGVRIKENDPQKRVLYVSTHLFQVQYTNAVRNNKVNDFIGFYQSIDVLLIDDVQELANQTKTQNTFFHIFNHLHQSGKQLVMTSDRPPKMLEGMEPRLLTRFKWGLTVSVERPDYCLRKNILVNKIKQDGLDIREEVIDYIARNATDNVRDLEGVIVSLMAQSTIFNREITIDMAERVLNNSVHMEKKQINIDLIQQTVCTFYELDPKLLQSKTRKREIALARQIAMFLSKKYTDLSFSRIGDCIGKRDHATVLHACKTIGDQYEMDKALHANIDEIEEILKR